MDERELVRQAQAGDRAALDGLIGRYAPLLRSLTRVYLGPADAADAAQEIWLAVHQKLWQLNDGEAFASWLRKVAYYHCLNVRKARGRRRQREVWIGTLEWGRLAAFVADDDAGVEDAHRSAPTNRPDAGRAAGRLWPAAAAAVHAGDGVARDCGADRVAAGHGQVAPP